MTQRFPDDPQAIPAAKVIQKAIVRAYDTATHKAAVQIVGSHPTQIDDVRVATNIPPADVVTGRQCTVLFLDPSNQDDAVIIAVQGALPSVGQILVASATANLTLTTTAQSITGDGDSSKVRLLLPTPGDWLIEAACDFTVAATDPEDLIGELFVNDSGTPEAGDAVLHVENAERATVAQRWKVTTTAADTPVELKARKSAAGGTAYSYTHTRITATGVKRSTAGGGVSDHGALTGLGDHDHSIYARLAQAETWAALQTFDAGLQLAAGQAVKDSGGTARIKLSTSSPHVEIDDDLRAERIGVGSPPNSANRIRIRPIESTAVTLTILDVTPTITALGNISLNAVQGVAALQAINAGSHSISGLNFTVNPTCLPGVTALFTNANALVVTAQPIAVSTGVVNVTNMRGAKIVLNASKLAGAAAPAITDLYLIEAVQGWIAANATVTNYHGFEHPDLPMTPAGYDRLMEMGGVIGTTPNLRLEGKAPSDPGASKGRSQLLLSHNENGTVNLRRVEWIDSGAAGGAGIPANAKLLVAV